MFYYNLGSFIAAFGYYTGRHKGLISRGERDLFRHKDGTFDMEMILLSIVSLLIGGSILPLLNINFSLANMAGLNIGITQTVHALQTFFVAILDYFVFGDALKRSQFVGMVIIIACVIMISLDRSQPVDTGTETHLAVYIPMAFSFIVPVA